MGALPPLSLTTEVALSWLGVVIILSYMAVHENSAQSITRAREALIIISSK